MPIRGCRDSRPTLACIAASAALTGVLVAACAKNAQAQVWEVSDRVLAASVSNDGAEHGHAVAVGDFNADGIDDLAIAAPGTDVDPFTGVGRLQILLGGAAGRSFTVRIDISPLGGGSPDIRLGFTMVAGNFDGSPQDELAIGAVGGGFSGVPSGQVVIASPQVPSQSVNFFYFGQTDVPAPAGGVDGAGDEFGHALAVGDFNDDGFEDLAIGAPFRDHGGVVSNSGRVYVAYGSPLALLVDASTQGFTSESVLAEARYGSALAAGDFDDDGFDDLAVGEPGRDIGGQAAAGRVEVLFGSATGISFATPLLYTNASFGITNEAGDEFGSVLAVGDFNRADLLGCLADGCADDLAIGSPLEDIGAVADAGLVIVSYGQRGIGPSSANFQLIDQSDLGFDVEDRDHFGAALAAGQLDATSIFDANRRGDDLAIGVPGEDVEISGTEEQGALHLLFADAGNGLALATTQLQLQFAGYGAAPGADGDHFGAALGIGDFDGDGAGDLAIGIPGREVGPLADAGLVQVLFGALFADGFESGFLAKWSAVEP